MRQILRMIVVSSTVLSGMFALGSMPAFAACSTTAVSAWGDNCTVSTTSYKYSRYTLAIQYILKMQGYYSGPYDGDFGQGTYDAVKDFQTAHSLTRDGVVGTNTWNALRNELHDNGLVGSWCPGYEDYNVKGTALDPFMKNNSTGTWWITRQPVVSGSCTTSSYVMNTSAP